MNDFENTNGQASAADATKAAAYCQNCGKALDQESMRVVGPAVYCEACLAARLSGAPESATAAGAPPAAAWAAGTWTPKSAPNPALAGLLGLIPGVGAMYNEQYAKGLFHLLIFVVLVKLADVSGFFVLFVIGWVFYMAIEAHHTAKARRDGTVLPNPFGLNDLGERLGFNKTWPAGQAATGTAAGAYPPPPASAYVPPVEPVYGTPVNMGYAPPVTPNYGQPAGTWGAPAEAYDAAAAYAAGAANSPYAQQYGPVYGAGYAPGYVPPVANPYGVPYPPVPPIAGVEPAYVAKGNRFPAGAIWLIGLGTIFLLSTTGIFHTLFGWTLVGFVLIGLAVWVFLRKMTCTGASLANDGTAGYPLRIVRALNASVWLLLVGVLMLLNEYDVLLWRRSWPLFIILAGVMALVQRAAYNAAAQTAYEAAQMPPSGAAQSANAGNPYSIVPTGTAQNADKNEGVL
jgi:hypothetical protein